MEKLLDDQKIDKRQRDEGVTGSGAAGEASGRRWESKRYVELSTGRNKGAKSSAGRKVSPCFFHI